MLLLALKVYFIMDLASSKIYDTEEEAIIHNTEKGIREWMVKEGAHLEEIAEEITLKKLKWSHKTQKQCLKWSLKKKWNAKMKPSLSNRNQKSNFQKEMKRKY